MKRLSLMLALLTLVFALVASAHTIAFTERTMAGGQVLKAGEYKVDVEGTRVTIHNGEHKIELVAKQILNAPHKFEQSQVLVNSTDGKNTLEEIRIGGSTTRLIFTDNPQPLE